MTFFPETDRVIRYFSQQHRGKGPMDGIGGYQKNLVFHTVLSKEVVIQFSEDFENFADYHIRKVFVKFMLLSGWTRYH